ncbi:MAG TPA: ATP-binding protein [Pseudonocardiaceae bacterium]|nr:ATP-binding protein [Pseudonocardiaceae bacterium]
MPGLDHTRLDAPAEIEVRIPASASQLSIVRAVVSDIAMRADYDLDAIADLKLAVDEACGALVAAAEPASDLLCRFVIRAAEITVCASAPTTDATLLRQNTFGWHVLNALADEVRSWVSDEVAHIELVKRRAKAADA